MTDDGLAHDLPFIDIAGRQASLIAWSETEKVWLRPRDSALVFVLRVGVVGGVDQIEVNLGPDRGRWLDFLAEHGIEVVGDVSPG